MPLSRYRIVRGRRDPGDPLPEGVRQDTRKHTRHCLRPSAELVAEFLGDPASEEAWERFRTAYRAIVAARFQADPSPFEAIAAIARERPVWLGCNCPTQKNPDPRRCHTVLALAFMAERFPDLEIDSP